MPGNNGAGRSTPHTPSVPSTAAIRGRPLHPILVVFPIGLLIGAFACDLVFWGTGDPGLAQASFWLIAAGLLVGIVAAALGLIDFLTIRRARSHSAGWIHAIGNGLAIILSSANLALRLGNPITWIVPGGLVLSAITAAILGVTALYGGELAYRYKIGADEYHEKRVQ